MATDDGERAPGAGARLLAVVFDAGTLVLLLLAGLVVAFAWLLVRTSWGRFDVGTGDALVATSLIGATVPAWAAWLAARLHLHGATPGEARLGLAVEGEPWRRAARLLAHPISLPLWGWLTLTVLITELRVLLLPAVFVLLAVAVAGLLSLGMLLVRGHARLLHDYVFGTRIVRRR